MYNNKIFFSYSRKDAEFVVKLVNDLKSKAFNIWIDQANIRAGEKWDESVQMALTGCKLVIVILSPSSVSSQNVSVETNFAIESGKKIIPVIARKCIVPMRLAVLQYIDFSEDYDQGLSKLLYALSDSQNDSGPLVKLSRKKKLKRMLVLFALISFAIIAVLFWLNPILVNNQLSRPMDIDTSAKASSIKFNSSKNIEVLKDSATYNDLKSNVDKNNINEKPAERKRNTTAKQPGDGDRIEYVNVKIFVNSEFQNAQITVDGEPGEIVSNGLTIKKIRVANNKNHTFLLSENGKFCAITEFIKQNDQELKNLTCN